MQKTENPKKFGGESTLVTFVKINRLGLFRAVTPSHKSSPTRYHESQRTYSTGVVFTTPWTSFQRLSGQNMHASSLAKRASVLSSVIQLVIVQYKTFALQVRTLESVHYDFPCRNMLIQFSSVCLVRIVCQSFTSYSPLGAERCLIQVKIGNFVIRIACERSFKHEMLDISFEIR